MNKKIHPKLKNTNINFKKILLIILGIVFILLVIISLFSTTCDHTYITDKDVSPDGTYTVQVQNNSCGGGAGSYTTNMVVEKTKKNITESFGNSRIDALILMGPKPLINTMWVNDHTLKVSFSDCRSVNTQENFWGDLKIIYEGSCKADKYGNPI